MSITELKVEPIASELGDELEKLYLTKKRAFVKVGEKKWYLPYGYAKNGDKLYNFKIHPDDTWIVTYPRSGTTVMQELTWLVANDLNFDEAHRRTLLERFPFIEISVLIDNHTTAERNHAEGSINYVQDQPSPRFIKSHLPLELLPTVVNSDCKIIYVARNPKDVVVSWYHFQKHQEHLQYAGTFEHFCDMFIADHTIYSPYWEHVKEGWAKRHRANTLFFFYEDLNKDLPGVIEKVATFFGKSYSEEQIAKLVKHLNIDNFRKNPMVNQASPNNNRMKPEKFIRQGKTGGWKEIFTPEIEEKFNKWIADNLKNTDLTFPS
ncbi:sulfotransferase 4A1-like [Linepithema humile]|uniref:sulfotransferase 4A1-like n=1 Tax=Linepithema humile TaxID=83485 RepID=UPI00351E0E02